MAVRWIDHERLVRFTTQTGCHLFVFFRQISRFGTYSVDHAINAGLDLEMPGVNKWRTFEKVERSIVARKVVVHTIKERAKKVLELVQKCAREAPEVRDDNPLTTGLVIKINLCS
jgi:hypothetical protein